MTGRPLVYVAGPITSDPWGCVGKAMTAWKWLRSIDTVPILPQLSVIAEMVDPQPYEAWMDYDMALLARCDALLRLPGESPGADREVDEASRLGLLVASMESASDRQILTDWAATEVRREPT